jgi:hypothetical protein
MESRSPQTAYIAMEVRYQPYPITLAQRPVSELQKLAVENQ